MPQGDFIELHQKWHGWKLDHEEWSWKWDAWSVHEEAQKAQTLTGIKAKIHAKMKYKEKVEMKKKIKAHEEKDAMVKDETKHDGAIPTYLMDREEVNRTKILSNMIKQKRKEKAGKWKVPIDRVQALSEEQMFRVIKTGKWKKKAYKRLVNKATFVPENFVWKPPKLERYIRPSGMRFKKAHVVHPELKTTFCLDIIGVKKNP